MKRLLLTSRLTAFAFGILLLATAAYGQNAQVTWEQPGVVSATQAQGFTYKLYVTPAGSQTTSPPVTLNSILCGGTAPTVACSTVLPSSASQATITGAKSTLTTTDTANGGAESAPSAPFIKPTVAPINLKVIP